MSILSTSSRLIKVGQEYSAGSGISIDDYIISVTSVPGTTYSAGENITIEDNIISSKDWSQDIADASANAYEAATAQIPDPFDPTFISGQIDNKLDSTAFTNWQNSQYATDLQTIEGQINNKLDTSSFSDVSGSFLTAINIPESATWNEVSQAYEQASATYLTSVSIPESATWQDVSTTVQTNSAQWAEGGTGGDEEVNSFVYNNSASINDVNSSYKTNSGNFLTAAPADMATTGDMADLAHSVSETYQVKGDYLTTADSDNFYPSNNPSGFITGVDLSNYYQKNETSGKEELANAFANIPVGDTEVNAYVHNNSASIDESTNVVQSNSSIWNDITVYQSNSANYITAHQSLDGYATTSEVNTVSSLLSAGLDYVSANAGGTETISSYTTVWSPNVPPYGSYVINSLNGLNISANDAKSSNSAGYAKIANIANSAGYAQTVDETKLENDGFVKNLSSEYGTISVIHNNLIESTNSAISRVGNEGFVSSFVGKTIGPEATANFSWDKALPNTIIALDMGWNNGFTLTYSANTNLTGEVVLPVGTSTQTINIPNATEFRAWANGWVNLNKAVVSAADSFETVVGELAWASALPTYEYDSTNKISAINGSALAGGGNPEVENYVVTNSAAIDETVGYVQTNSAVLTGMIDGKQDTLTFGYDEQDRINSINNSALAGGGASYTSPSSTIWISDNKIESTDSAYIPTHQEDVLLTATTSWSSMNGYATLANTNKVLFRVQANRASAFDNEGTFLNSANNTTAWAETEYPPIKLYTNTWVNVQFSAYSAGITDAYVVELARKNEVNSALNTKLDSSAFRGYYPSNNPSGFAKTTDVLMQSGVNLFDGRVVGINNQYLMGCDSAYNSTLVGTSAATGTKTASAYVGTGHQGINIQVSARNIGINHINWTAFSENGSNLSAGQLELVFNSTTKNRISGFEISPPLAETVSGIKLYGNSTGFTAYSAYTIDVKPLASQNNITFLSGAIDYVSANAGGSVPDEVMSDASLSGNGTVDSPLGVVPGYNETVLWSGNSTVLNNTFNLSEPYTNFEKIRFKHCFEGSGIFVPIYTDYDTNILKNAANQGIGLSYNGCKAQNDLAGWNFGLANIVKVSDTQLSGRGAGYFALNAKSLITSNIYYIYEIRGINRKAQ